MKTISTWARGLVVMMTGSTLVTAGCSSAGAPAMVSSSSSAMGTLDPDADGTMDLPEAQVAAAKRFDTLDPDHDGTIDRKEAAVVEITPAEFRKFDTDKDGTLDKKEYAALVEARFKAANPDADGTIDPKELASAQGRLLLELLQ